MPQAIQEEWNAHQRYTDEEIRGHEANIAQLRASKPDDADFIEDEIGALKQTIKHLQERRELLVNMNG